MKKFLKERNPFLLISCIFSIVVLVFIVLFFNEVVDTLNNITTNDTIQFYDLFELNFLNTVFEFFILISLLNIVGYICKKEEFIFLSNGLLVILVFMLVIRDVSIELYSIIIIWCIINVIGLMKSKKV